jgi:isoleucyl-tRNA synthetase
MTDYKNTLNLPKTDFPMKANLSQREPDSLKFWQDIDLYQTVCKQNSGREKFILHDGPPYANGKIHQGGALNKILKDIVVKSKLMSGYDSPYVPGWDCHGLPIEVNVEKQIGRVGDKVTKDEFVQACRQYATEQKEIQKAGFIRLGVIGDWEHPYLTMDFKYEADVIRALGKIIANGHLTHGQKPVHWCTACGSALAEAEVEYREHNSPAIDVAFKVVNKQEFLKCLGLNESEGDIVVPIWTTTPWTLPANQAVALNPKLAYVLVKTPEKNLLIAKELLATVMERYAITDYTILAEVLGEKLEHIKLQHPFLERHVPLVLGEHVTVDAGTGAVHTAPGHGQDDYIIGVRYKLPIENPVDAHGKFLPNTQFFAGEEVFAANKHVIAVLQEKGNLLHSTRVQHSYPHCWRHKTPLIFRATPQWFISMDKNDLRQKTLAEIEKVEWIPDWGKIRIKNMVEQRPDWCISRQRLWGSPLTLLVHKETFALHPNSLELIEKIAQLVEKNGVEAWSKLAAKELIGDEAKDYEKTTDILDVWFDSGVSHTAVLRQRAELGYPAGIYLEGSDQHRGWFQSSLITAVAMYGNAPFKTVLTHGHVLDAKGYKMSKSLGNVISPEDLTKKFGADIIRLWVASTDYTDDIPCSEESIARTADAYRRIRNTVRFLLANTQDFILAEHAVAAEQMLALDRWIVDSARLLQAKIKQAYQQYQFHVIYHELHNFCTVELGSFYLDIIKDRQYTLKTDSLARRSAQTAIYYVLQALIRWLAPILSFTAEEIWRYLPDKAAASVFLTTWYDKLAAIPASDKMNQDFWQAMRQVKDEVNKELERQRAAGIIGAGLEAEVILFCEERLLEKLQLLGDELRFVFITSGAKALPLAHAPSDAVNTDNSGLRIKVEPSTYKKCIRCWHHRSDVGSDPSHPEICSRCVANITGSGEQRKYV